MAPDRGNSILHRNMSREPASNGAGQAGPDISDEALPNEPTTHQRQPEELECRTDPDDIQKILAARAGHPGNFTVRGVVVGLVIGVVICFSNVYFGLQTGWISGMTMPAALIGYAFFTAIKKHLKLPFSPVENVLIQTVAGCMGAMPLGCGFVGIIPALEFLLRPDENGPLHLSTGTLCLWGIGVCLFGVVFAVPLRKQVIIREKLKFPTGSATALMIGVLHGGREDAQMVNQNHDAQGRGGQSHDVVHPGTTEPDQTNAHASEAEMLESYSPNPAGTGDWQSKIRLMFLAFGGSALYTLVSYFIPILHNLPVFGFPAARKWLWTFNPSPAYVGQGIIMGPATTTHMLLGAIVGWGILSPLAKDKGWAPGPVGDWETGSKGWIVWVSLAIMLADAIVSLGWLALRPLVAWAVHQGPKIWANIKKKEWRDLKDRLLPISPRTRGYSSIPTDEHATGPNPSTQANSKSATADSDDESEYDAPAANQISSRTLLIGIVVSVAVYFASIHLSFPQVMPFSASLLALFLGLILSIMGVRALGSTDLNPVSGISKLTQLFFALIPFPPANSIIINLLAGGVSEAGAIQAGDLMQDLKAGHLLGAAPSAQFHGQIIGSLVGSVVSAAIYKLYTRVYTIPSGQFQVPTAFVWIFTARLVTGKGLPEMAPAFAVGAGAVFAVLTAIRTAWMRNSWVQTFVPGGIAFAVGMYNTPSFTLARAIGGLITWYWTRWRGKKETGVVVVASGLILGEGLFSIVSLILASLGVPHL